jgi:hypothetical protein
MPCRNNKVKKAAAATAALTQKYIHVHFYYSLILIVSSSIAVVTQDKVHTPLPLQVSKVVPPIVKLTVAKKMTPAPISMDEKVAYIQDYLNHIDKVFHDTFRSLIWFKAFPELFELETKLRYQRLLIEAGIRLARPGWHPDTLRHGRKALKKTTLSNLQQGEKVSSMF